MLGGCARVGEAVGLSSRLGQTVTVQRQIGWTACAGGQRDMHAPLLKRAQFAKSKVHRAVLAVLPRGALAPHTVLCEKSTATELSIDRLKTGAVYH